jgi:hypothetical protein
MLSVASLITTPARIWPRKSLRLLPRRLTSNPAMAQDRVSVSLALDRTRLRCQISMSDEHQTPQSAFGRRAADLVGIGF